MKQVTLTEATFTELITELKNRFGLIEHVWVKDDITDRADDIGVELTDDEIEYAISILEETDCNIGINWNTIDYAIGVVKNNQ